jgi:lipopolysaccharide/colanic/teichoic acid biosynthesis glycosyltransferase
MTEAPLTPPVPCVRDDGWYAVQKRALDVAVSAAGVAALSPLLVTTAALIKLDSPGPVFYRGLRLGRGGQPFHMLKFRTMVVDAERRGGLATPEGDPRVTRVGSVLRKYKLDELPQLINVLKGDMSLVGPRPEAPLYFDYYPPGDKEIILSVRPGITDYGSLHYHDEGKLLTGADDPVIAYIERVMHDKIKLQKQYIAERSLLVDCKIILATIGRIISTRLLPERRELDAV